MKLLKIATLFTAMIFVLAGCTANEAAVGSKEPAVTASQAESAALTHAGVAPENAVGLHSQFDCDDGTANYDVEFYADGYEYDYEINADTGEVIRFEKEPEKRPDATTAATTTTAAPAPTEQAATEEITRDEAVSIALSHAGVAQSDAKRLEVDYDRDNGVNEYEVSFDYNGYEYDYDINAQTGEIITHHKEIDD